MAQVPGAALAPGQGEPKASNRVEVSIAQDPLITPPVIFSAGGRKSMSYVDRGWLRKR
jgi:hypothetical protein